MEHYLRTQLLGLVSAYADRSGLAEATLAQRAAGDWRFFDGLRQGKSFRVRTFDQVVSWFHDHWPAGLDWPADVPRPSDPAPTSSPALASGCPSPRAPEAPSSEVAP